MMKTAVRTFTLLLICCLILGVFAGCTSGGSTTTPSETPNTSASTPASSQGADQGSENAQTEEYVFRMPITSDAYTITAWRSYSSTILTSPNEILANQELEKRTNIHLEYQLAPTVDGQTQYNLMVQSGDYTDILFQGIQGPNVTQYTGGFDKGLDDEVFLELTDVIDRWMPNVKQYMSDPEIRKGFLTDSGRVAGIVNVMTEGGQPPFVGPGIRQDMLDKVGITKLPETLDELHTALSKFKNELGVESPLNIQTTGIGMPSSITGAFQMDPGFFMDGNTVKFGILEQGMRDYLEMMRQWYAEGLIDQEFYTRTDSTVARERMSSDKVGASVSVLYTLPHIYKMMSDNPDYHLVAIPYLKKNVGDSLHFVHVLPATGNTYIVITTAVKDQQRLENIARWIDYRFTEEGSVLLNYGIEGDTYQIVNGAPMYTDKVVNNPDGTSANDMIAIITDSSHGAIYDWTRERAMVTEEEWSFYDVWGNSGDNAGILPGRATKSTEEGQEYSRLYSDIETYVSENIPLFIIGTKSMAEYDAFVDQIRSMNIDRCIEIQQASVDRYMKK